MNLLAACSQHKFEALIFSNGCYFVKLHGFTCHKSVILTLIIASVKQLR